MAFILLLFVLFVLVCGFTGFVVICVAIGRALQSASGASQQRRLEQISWRALRKAVAAVDPQRLDLLLPGRDAVNRMERRHREGRRRLQAIQRMQREAPFSTDALARAESELPAELRPDDPRRSALDDALLGVERLDHLEREASAEIQAIELEARVLEGRLRLESVEPSGPSDVLQQLRGARSDLDALWVARREGEA